MSAKAYSVIVKSSCNQQKSYPVGSNSSSRSLSHSWCCIAELPPPSGPLKLGLALRCFLSLSKSQTSGIQSKILGIFTKKALDQSQLKICLFNVGPNHSSPFISAVKFGRDDVDTGNLQISSCGIITKQSKSNFKTSI